MAVGDSVIRVAILGDTKSLEAAVGRIDTKLGNIGKGAKIAAGAFVAFQAVGGVVDFLGGAVEKADDYADALERIEGLVTPAFAQEIEDIAFSFTQIGLSADEVASMSASFLALGTAAGITEDALKTALPDILTLAAAISATTGKPIDEVVTDIGKAAGGQQKAIADYGVAIDTALNPDQQLTSVLEQLKILFPEAGDALGDFTGKTEQLGAKWDNVTIKIGEHLEGPLGDLLDWVIGMVDSVDNAIAGWQMLAQTLGDFARRVLGPLGNVADVISRILAMIPGVKEGLAATGIASFGTSSVNLGDPFRQEHSTVNDQRDRSDRNGVVNQRIGGP